MSPLGLARATFSWETGAASNTCLLAADLESRLALVNKSLALAMAAALVIDDGRGAGDGLYHYEDVEHLLEEHEWPAWASENQGDGPRSAIRFSLYSKFAARALGEPRCACNTLSVSLCMHCWCCRGLADKPPPDTTVPVG